MDIGLKLKNARIQAGCTQEQAAEALGVSRQTISNWETEKTYPDIISVIKMSDLYKVSLDSLLKGETPVPTYLDYLAESTDTVQSRKRLSKTVLLGVYLALWCFSIGVFWLFTSGSDAMGFALVYLWLLLPVTTFSLSLIMGKSRDWGRERWIYPLVFGAFYMLAEYATFSAANMLTFQKLNAPAWEMLPLGAVISLLGMSLGAGLRHLSARRQKKQND